MEPSNTYFYIYLIVVTWAKSAALDVCKGRQCECLGNYVDCSSRKLKLFPMSMPLWVENLDLSKNKLSSLKSDTLNNFPNLKELNLNSNRIHFIELRAFESQILLHKLDLSLNRLRVIEALRFQKLTKLTFLKLKRNYIHKLNDGAFHGLDAINRLHLGNNLIQNITTGWLFGLGSLTELILSHNNISSIEPKTWTSVQRLIFLDISFNKLQSINSDLLKLPQLRVLKLNNNFISQVATKAFISTPFLIELNLSHNMMSSPIESTNGIFNGLNKLESLLLCNNSIQTISIDAFSGLNKLISLDLRDNSVSFIQKNSLDKLRFLEKLQLSTKNLVCDCNLQWFYHWLTSRNLDIRLTCAHPHFLRGRSLFELNHDELVCEEQLKPTLIEQPQNSITALSSEAVSFICKAMSNSNSSILFHWTKDGADLTMNTSDLMLNYDNGTYVAVSLLNILKVQRTDAGSYQCSATNEFGSTYSNKSLLLVQVYPNFVHRPENITLEVGQTAKLNCTAEGEPKPVVVWQKDGGNDFPAARERRMKIMTNDNVFFILNVKPSDVGVYSCIAKSTAGKIVANASISIYERPFFIKSMENQLVRPGDLVVLQCLGGGTPKPNITWLTNGQPVSMSERRHLTAEDQLLIIMDVMVDDMGQYECHLSNRFGTAVGKSILRIIQNITVKTKTFDDGVSIVPIVGLRDDAKNINNSMKYLPMFPIQHSTTAIPTGVLIIAMVCCAVATSVVWVIIIYHTRKRFAQDTSAFPSSPVFMTATANDHIKKVLQEATEEYPFLDKDSGTDDCGTRSNNELLPLRGELECSEEHHHQSRLQEMEHANIKENIVSPMVNSNDHETNTFGVSVNPFGAKNTFTDWRLPGCRHTCVIHKTANGHFHTIASSKTRRGYHNRIASCTSTISIDRCNKMRVCDDSMPFALGVRK